MRSSPLLAAALDLAALGYPVIPLNEDRRPVVKGWPDATLEEDATSRRFDRMGVAGLAIVLRPPLFVIDLDRGHADGIDGIASFDALVRRFEGSVPSGPRVRSLRGGLHLYLRAPLDVTIKSSASTLGLGIDVKGARSCATVPPTCGYRWIAQPCLADQVPLAPDWLIDLVRYRPPSPLPPIVLTSVRAGERWAEVALAGEAQRVASCAPGTRNATLFKSSARLGSLCAAGMLSGEIAARHLLAAAEACGLTREDGAGQVHATIANGLRAGSKTPVQTRRWRQPND